MRLTASIRLICMRYHIIINWLTREPGSLFLNPESTLLGFGKSHQFTLLGLQLASFINNNDIIDACHNTSMKQKHNV